MFTVNGMAKLTSWQVLFFLLTKTWLSLLAKSDTFVIQNSIDYNKFFSTVDQRTKIEFFKNSSVSSFSTNCKIIIVTIWEK